MFRLANGGDDKVVAENALGTPRSARRVLFDLHLYEKGRHGIGLGIKDGDPEKMHPRTKDRAYWLKQQGFTK